MANIKVAVRVRPLLKREIDNGDSVIVDVDDTFITIKNAKLESRGGAVADSRERKKTFAFDACYDSMEETSGCQELVFQDLGLDILQSAFDGFDACLFAYGQTGTGKTFTMMGTNENPGLTPRICEVLFSRVYDETLASADNAQAAVTYKVEASYFEIYNERVRDLLRPTTAGKEKFSLKVREHPKTGPFVEDLSTFVVRDLNEITKLIDRGNQRRITAATHMHAYSSRSHAIFQITFSQASIVDGLPSEIASRVNLVDLAGSERGSPNEVYTRERMKEGSNINRSLITLGNVITALAERGSNNSPTDGDSIITGSSSSGYISSPARQQSQRSTFIPYRDSVLTWLLRNSLGGSAKTVMVATVSPSAANYTESLSTLLYAQRAKSIVNVPSVNEDANVRLIRELRQEIYRLREILAKTNLESGFGIQGSLSERLECSEQMAEKLTKCWIDKWFFYGENKQEPVLCIRRPNSDRRGSAVLVESQLPHLVALDEDDVTGTGVLIYHLDESGRTLLGTDINADIGLRGPGVSAECCSVQTINGRLALVPHQTTGILINGSSITEPTPLSHGDLLVLGYTNVFRFNNPIEAARLRQSCANLSSVSSVSTLSLDSAAAFLGPSHRSRPTRQFTTPFPSSPLAAGVTGSSSLFASTQSLNAIGNRSTVNPAVNRLDLKRCRNADSSQFLFSPDSPVEAEALSVADICPLTSDLPASAQFIDKELPAPLAWLHAARVVSSLSSRYPTASVAQLRRRAAHRRQQLLSDSVRRARSCDSLFDQTVKDQQLASSSTAVDSSEQTSHHHHPLLSSSSCACFSCSFIDILQEVAEDLEAAAEIMQNRSGLTPTAVSCTHQSVAKQYTTVLLPPTRPGPDRSAGARQTRIPPSGQLPPANRAKAQPFSVGGALSSGGSQPRQGSGSGMGGNGLRRTQPDGSVEPPDNAHVIFAKSLRNFPPSNPAQASSPSPILHPQHAVLLPAMTSAGSHTYIGRQTPSGDGQGGEAPCECCRPPPSPQKRAERRPVMLPAYEKTKEQTQSRTRSAPRPASTICTSGSREGLVDAARQPGVMRSSVTSEPGDFLNGGETVTPTGAILLPATAKTRKTRGQPTANSRRGRALQPSHTADHELPVNRGDEGQQRIPGSARKRGRGGSTSLKRRAPRFGVFSLTVPLPSSQSAPRLYSASEMASSTNESENLVVDLEHIESTLKRAKDKISASQGHRVKRSTSSASSVSPCSMDVPSSAQSTTWSTTASPQLPGSQAHGGQHNILPAYASIDVNSVGESDERLSSDVEGSFIGRHASNNASPELRTVGRLSKSPSRKHETRQQKSPSSMMAKAASKPKMPAVSGQPTSSISSSISDLDTKNNNASSMASQLTITLPSSKGSPRSQSAAATLLDDMVAAAVSSISPRTGIVLSRLECEGGYVDNIEETVASVARRRSSSTDRNSATTPTTVITVASRRHSSSENGSLVPAPAGYLSSRRCTTCSCNSCTGGASCRCSASFTTDCSCSCTSECTEETSGRVTVPTATHEPGPIIGNASLAVPEEYTDTDTPRHSSRLSSSTLAADNSPVINRALRNYGADAEETQQSSFELNSQIEGGQDESAILNLCRSVLTALESNEGQENFEVSVEYARRQNQNRSASQPVTETRPGEKQPGAGDRPAMVVVLNPSADLAKTAENLKDICTDTVGWQQLESEDQAATAPQQPRTAHFEGIVRPSGGSNEELEMDVDIGGEVYTVVLPTAAGSSKELLIRRSSAEPLAAEIDTDAKKQPASSAVEESNKNQEDSNAKRRCTSAEVTGSKKVGGDEGAEKSLPKPTTTSEEPFFPAGSGTSGPSAESVKKALPFSSTTTVTVERKRPEYPIIPLGRLSSSVGGGINEPGAPVRGRKAGSCKQVYYQTSRSPSARRSQSRERSQPCLGSSDELDYAAQPIKHQRHSYTPSVAGAKLLPAYPICKRSQSMDGNLKMKGRSLAKQPSSQAKSGPAAPVAAAVQSAVPLRSSVSVRSSQKGIAGDKNEVVVSTANYMPEGVDREGSLSSTSSVHVQQTIVRHRKSDSEHYIAGSLSGSEAIPSALSTEVLTTTTAITTAKDLARVQSPQQILDLHESPSLRRRSSSHLRYSQTGQPAQAVEKERTPSSERPPLRRPATGSPTSDSEWRRSSSADPPSGRQHRSPERSAPGHRRTWTSAAALSPTRDTDGSIRLQSYAYDDDRSAEQQQVKSQHNSRIGSKPERATKSQPTSRTHSEGPALERGVQAEPRLENETRGQLPPSGVRHSPSLGDSTQLPSDLLKPVAGPRGASADVTRVRGVAARVSDSKRSRSASSPLRSSSPDQTVSSRSSGSSLRQMKSPPRQEYYRIAGDEEALSTRSSMPSSSISPPPWIQQWALESELIRASNRSPHPLEPSGSVRTPRQEAATEEQEPTSQTPPAQGPLSFLTPKSQQLLVDALSRVSSGRQSRQSSGSSRHSPFSYRSPSPSQHGEIQAEESALQGQHIRSPVEIASPQEKSLPADDGGSRPKTRRSPVSTDLDDVPVDRVGYSQPPYRGPPYSPRHVRSPTSPLHHSDRNSPELSAAVGGSYPTSPKAEDTLPTTSPRHAYSSAQTQPRVGESAKSPTSPYRARSPVEQDAKSPTLAFQVGSPVSPNQRGNRSPSPLAFGLKVAVKGEKSPVASPPREFRSSPSQSINSPYSFESESNPSLAFASPGSKDLARDSRPSSGVEGAMSPALPHQVRSPSQREVCSPYSLESDSISPAIISPVPRDSINTEPADVCSSPLRASPVASPQRFGAGSPQAIEQFSGSPGKRSPISPEFPIESADEAVEPSISPVKHHGSPSFEADLRRSPERLSPLAVETFATGPQKRAVSPSQTKDLSEDGRSPFEASSSQYQSQPSFAEATTSVENTLSQQLRSTSPRQRSPARGDDTSPSPVSSGVISPPSIWRDGDRVKALSDLKDDLEKRKADLTSRKIETERDTCSPHHGGRSKSVESPRTGGAQQQQAAAGGQSIEDILNSVRRTTDVLQQVPTAASAREQVAASKQRSSSSDAVRSGLPPLPPNLVSSKVVDRSSPPGQISPGRLSGSAQRSSRYRSAEGRPTPGSSRSSSGDRGLDFALVPPPPGFQTDDTVSPSHSSPGNQSAARSRTLSKESESGLSETIKPSDLPSAAEQQSGRQVPAQDWKNHEELLMLMLGMPKQLRGLAEGKHQARSQSSRSFTDPSSPATEAEVKQRSKSADAHSYPNYSQEFAADEIRSVHSEEGRVPFASQLSSSQRRGHGEPAIGVAADSASSPHFAAVADDTVARRKDNMPALHGEEGSVVGQQPPPKQEPEERAADDRLKREIGRVIAEPMMRRAVSSERPTEAVRLSAALDPGDFEVTSVEFTKRRRTPGEEDGGQSAGAPVSTDPSKQGPDDEKTGSKATEPSFHDVEDEEVKICWHWLQRQLSTSESESERGFRQSESRHSSFSSISTRGQSSERTEHTITSSKPPRPPSSGIVPPLAFRSGGLSTSGSATNVTQSPSQSSTVAAVTDANNVPRDVAARRSQLNAEFMSLLMEASVTICALALAGYAGGNKELSEGATASGGQDDQPVLPPALSNLMRTVTPRPIRFSPVVQLVATTSIISSEDAEDAGEEEMTEDQAESGDVAGELPAGITHEDQQEWQQSPKAAGSRSPGQSSRPDHRSPDHLMQRPSETGLTGSSPTAKGRHGSAEPRPAFHGEVALADVTENAQRHPLVESMGVAQSDRSFYGQPATPTATISRCSDAYQSGGFPTIFSSSTSLSLSITDISTSQEPLPTVADSYVDILSLPGRNQGAASAEGRSRFSPGEIAISPMLRERGLPASSQSPYFDQQAAASGYGAGSSTYTDDILVQQQQGRHLIATVGPDGQTAHLSYEQPSGAQVGRQQDTIVRSMSAGTDEAGMHSVATGTEGPPGSRCRAIETDAQVMRTAAVGTDLYIPASKVNQATGSDNDVAELSSRYFVDASTDPDPDRPRRSGASSRKSSDATPPVPHIDVGLGTSDSPRFWQTPATFSEDALIRFYEQCAARHAAQYQQQSSSGSKKDRQRLRHFSSSSTSAAEALGADMGDDLDKDKSQRAAHQRRARSQDGRREQVGVSPVACTPSEDSITFVFMEHPDAGGAPSGTAGQQQQVRGRSPEYLSARDASGRRLSPSGSSGPIKSETSMSRNISSTPADDEAGYSERMSVRSPSKPSYREHATSPGLGSRGTSPMDLRVPAYASDKAGYSSGFWATTAVQTELIDEAIRMMQAGNESMAVQTDMPVEEQEKQRQRVAELLESLTQPRPIRRARSLESRSAYFDESGTETGPSPGAPTPMQFSRGKGRQESSRYNLKETGTSASPPPLSRGSREKDREDVSPQPPEKASVDVTQKEKPKTPVTGARAQPSAHQSRSRTVVEVPPPPLPQQVNLASNAREAVGSKLSPTSRRRLMHLLGYPVSNETTEEQRKQGTHKYGIEGVPNSTIKQPDSPNLKHRRTGRVNTQADRELMIEAFKIERQRELTLLSADEKLALVDAGNEAGTTPSSSSNNLADLAATAAAAAAAAMSGSNSPRPNVPLMRPSQLCEYHRLLRCSMIELTKRSESQLSGSESGLTPLPDAISSSPPEDLDAGPGSSMNRAASCQGLSSHSRTHTTPAVHSAAPRSSALQSQSHRSNTDKSAPAPTSASATAQPAHRSQRSQQPQQSKPTASSSSVPTQQPLSISLASQEQTASTSSRHYQRQQQQQLEQQARIGLTTQDRRHLHRAAEDYQSLLMVPTQTQPHGTSDRRTYHSSRNYGDVSSSSSTVDSPASVRRSLPTQVPPSDSSRRQRQQYREERDRRREENFYAGILGSSSDVGAASSRMLPSLAAVPANRPSPLPVTTTTAQASAYMRPSPLVPVIGDNLPAALSSYRQMQQQQHSLGQYYDGAASLASAASMPVPTQSLFAASTAGLYPPQSNSRQPTQSRHQPTRPRPQVNLNDWGEL